jgi:hypothetical protein
VVRPRDDGRKVEAIDAVDVQAVIEQASARSRVGQVRMVATLCRRRCGSDATMRRFMEI